MKKLAITACLAAALGVATELPAQTRIEKTYQFIDHYPKRTVFFHLDLLDDQLFRVNLLDTGKETGQTGDTLVIRGFYRKQGDNLILQDQANEQNTFTVVQELHRVTVRGTYFLPSRNQLMTLNHANQWHAGGR